MYIQARRAQSSPRLYVRLSLSVVLSLIVYDLLLKFTVNRLFFMVNNLLSISELQNSLNHHISPHPTHPHESEGVWYRHISHGVGEKLSQCDRVCETSTKDRREKR